MALLILNIENTTKLSTILTQVDNLLSTHDTSIDGLVVQADNLDSGVAVINATLLSIAGEIDGIDALLVSHDGRITSVTSNYNAHAAAATPHSGHEQTARKNTASGYAGLDTGGKLILTLLGVNTPAAGKVLYGDNNWYELERDASRRYSFFMGG